MAAPWVLLVQLRQVRSSPAGKARPSARRAGQHVVTVRREADAGDDVAALGERVVEAELVVVAVQIVEAGRDDRALEVLPRAVADAVARVDRGLAVGGLGAEIGAPGLAARAVARRQASGNAGRRPRCRRDRRPCRGRAPVTKNVMFGACGSCGGARRCCCALTPDVTPSASAAAMNTFDLLILSPPFGFSEFYEAAGW